MPLRPPAEDANPHTMTWDGTPERARLIDAWARDGALNVRFSWKPTLAPGALARTLVERSFPQSAEWMPTPVGSVIERLGTEQESPLRVILPPDPIAILEEAA